MSVKEDNSALVSQCQDFCQTLADKSLIFSFTLSLGDSFSFSLDTSGKEAVASKAKKKTPSTLKRDARRRNEFVKKKLEVSTGEKTLDEKVFKCDQCTMGKLQWEVGKRNFSFLREKYIWNIWTRIKWEAKLTNLSEIF